MHPLHTPSTCTPSVPVSPPCTPSVPYVPHAPCSPHPIHTGCMSVSTWCIHMSPPPTLGALMSPHAPRPLTPSTPGVPGSPCPSVPMCPAPVSPCSKPVYTVLVVLLLASVTFPSGLGQFMASRLTMKEHLISLFDNRTWGLLAANASGVAKPEGLWQEWDHPSATIYGTLAFFLLMKFWMLILATTLPLPAGYFMPIFIYGAAIGRLIGEVVALLFPQGLHSDGPPRPILPAGYALAGAAAFAGSVTHAVSTALLVCEATGHLGHLLPTVLAVLVANAISQKNQPSFYDASIIVKKLPYLPPIRSRHIASYRVAVEEFMERQVVALAKGDGFQEVLVALDASADTEYPVVESTGSPTLVGTVSRSQLVTFLQSHEHPQAPQGEKLATVGTLRDDCTIEPVMLQFSPWTSLHQAYHLFQLLKLQRVFVTRSGELVGAVSRAE
ncbi:hypothetical protein DV515_00014723, partial [Chloebia gouldiae]